MRRSLSFSSLRKDVEVYEEEEEGDGASVINAYEGQSYSILKWPSSNKNRKPLVNFSAACVLVGTPSDSLETIRKYHLGYKFVKTECRLVRNILAAHGFKETNANSLQFNLMWTGTHLKPYTLRALTEYQKVNHFPRSYELTRKDRLYKNIQRMQHSKGMRHYDFVPQSFVLTSELNDFYATFMKDRGPWIVKPVASSRGRGIYLIGHPSQIPVHENVLVSKYIDNPMLINGFKYDCRLYVAVTCYDPLRLYIYQEGLARFSTVKYDKSSGSLANPWMHLTNYSVNKTSEDYVRCEDPEVDDYGSKWSFSAMLRHLRESGKDVEALMARIEDVIIKTIIAGEMSIATACKMFVPHRGNCFELFGFDILVDENMKPWLLEVNLSPSLVCDSPLDLKIKSNLISDLFNLTGFVADDQTLKKPPKLIIEAKRRQRQTSATYTSSELKSLAIKSINKINDGLTNEERKILRETKEEAKRCGGFVRIYPSPESWELYGSMQEHQTTHNRMLHSKLYPELWRASQRPQSATYIARARNFSSMNKPIPSQASEGSLNVSGQNFHQRFLIYQAKLASWSNFGQYAANDQGHFVPSASVHPNLKPQLVQGTPAHEIVKAELVQGVLLKAGYYEENLLLKQGYHQSSHADIVRNGQHLSKFQARVAFAVYLKRVQHRLVEETSVSLNQPYDCLSDHETEKQEQQIDLIHKFLVKAAVNLTNPIEIIVPKKSFPIKQRKKILAHQLIDFVQVYTKETEILVEREGKSTSTETRNVIDDETFHKFIDCASEYELEDILTIFTKHNKSASIFLGAKAPPVVNDAHVSNTGRDKSRPDSVIHYKSSEGLSMESKTNDKQAVSMVSGNAVNVMKDFERDSNGSPASSQMSSEHGRRSRQHKSKSKSSSLENKYHERHLSADPYTSNSSVKHSRPQSSKSRSRSQSVERSNKLSTVCAYTGASSAMKQQLLSHSEERSKRSSSAKSRTASLSSSPYANHVFGVDDPRLRKALKNLSLKQAERTYGTNNIASTISNSKPLNNKSSSFTDASNVYGEVFYDKHKTRSKSNKEGHDSETIERFIKYGQQFVVENKKSMQVDRNNYHLQSTSTQTVETSVQSPKSKVNSRSSEKKMIGKPGSYEYPSRERKVSNSENDIRLLLNDNQTTYNEPRPPDTKRPVIKKQINPHRINRLVGKR